PIGEFFAIVYVRGIAGKEGGVDEGRARGIELRYEAAAFGGARGRRESEAVRTRHVGVTAGVHGDPADAVTVVTNGTQVGGVDQGRARGIELRHEDVGALDQFSGGWGLA